MLSRANLLILDEPTNHLDVESIEALEDAIEDYDGTVMLVSHDRELLRALTTRVWVLHECHITNFDGSFGEWEQVAAEREHAARVQAAEEVAVRRGQEKKKTARREESTRDSKNSVRKAQREVGVLEGRVQDLEQRIASITGALEDPELYTTPDGIARATTMGTELEVLKSQLERALEAWTAASDTLAGLLA